MATACYASQTIQAFQCGHSGDSDGLDKFKLADGEHSDSFATPEHRRRRRRSEISNVESSGVGRKEPERGRHGRRERAGCSTA